MTKKKKNAIRIKTLKQRLDHGLILEKVHRITIQSASLVKALHRYEHKAKSKCQE